MTATEVIAALPGCCANEVQGEMVGLVFLLLLSLVAAVDSKVKAAALKALRGACSAAHDDRVVQDGCAHALCVLNDSLGMEWSGLVMGFWLIPWQTRQVSAPP
jgi:hypothetical protein